MDKLNTIIKEFTAGMIPENEALNECNAIGRDLERNFYEVSAKIGRAKWLIRNYNQLKQPVNTPSGVLLDTYRQLQNDKISFSQFKKVAFKCKRALLWGVNDLIRRAEKKEVLQLDCNQQIDYNYGENDDMAAFRVQVNNNRFGFTVPNPSDDIL